MWRSTLRISIQSVESDPEREAVRPVALGAGRCIAARAIVVCSHASASPGMAIRAYASGRRIGPPSAAYPRGTGTDWTCTPCAERRRECGAWDQRPTRRDELGSDSFLSEFGVRLLAKRLLGAAFWFKESDPLEH